MSRSKDVKAALDQTELLEKHIPGLRRFVCALLHGDRPAADDLVQDTLERALSRWHQRRRGGDLRGWIYTILYHRFITDRYRLRRRVEHKSLSEVQEADQPGVEGDQDRALARRDLMRMQLLTKESPHPSLLAIGTLAFVWGLIAPIAVDAEIIPVQSEASSDAVAAPSPPTVLRGSPPSTAKSVPGCPPGYTVAPDDSCIAPSIGDYSSGWPGYDYWPDYGWGWGWGYGGFSGFHRSHGFARFHGFRHFGHFASVHRFGGFHGLGARAGHMGGFGRR